MRARPVLRFSLASCCAPFSPSSACDRPFVLRLEVLRRCRRQHHHHQRLRQRVLHRLRSRLRRVEHHQDYTPRRYLLGRPLAARQLDDPPGSRVRRLPGSSRVCLLTWVDAVHRTASLRLACAILCVEGLLSRYTPFPTATDSRSRLSLRDPSLSLSGLPPSWRLGSSFRARLAAVAFTASDRDCHAATRASAAFTACVHTCGESNTTESTAATCSAGVYSCDNSTIPAVACPSSGWSAALACGPWVSGHDCGLQCGVCVKGLWTCAPCPDAATD